MELNIICINSYYILFLLRFSNWKNYYILSLNEIEGIEKSEIYICIYYQYHRDNCLKNSFSLILKNSINVWRSILEKTQENMS